jgi:DNA topoisomerase-3
LDKDGNPVARKSKTPPDLSKAEVIGRRSRTATGEILQTPDSYYVRRPDQDNRIVFTLKRHLCQKEIPAAEVLRLMETGRSELIPGFVSKRNLPFAAYLVLSKTGVKAEFEFLSVSSAQSRRPA